MKLNEKIKVAIQVILGIILTAVGVLFPLFGMTETHKFSKVYFFLVGLCLLVYGISSIVKRKDFKGFKMKILVTVLTPILLVVGFIPSMKFVEPEPEPETTTEEVTTTTTTTTKKQTTTTTKKATTTKTTTAKTTKATTKKKTTTTTTKKSTTTKKATTTVVKHKSNTGYKEVVLPDSVKTYPVYRKIGVPLLNDIGKKCSKKTVEKFIEKSGYTYVEGTYKFDLTVYSKPNSNGVRAYVAIGFSDDDKTLTRLQFGLDNDYKSTYIEKPESWTPKNKYKLWNAGTTISTEMSFYDLMETLYKFGYMSDEELCSSFDAITTTTTTKATTTSDSSYVPSSYKSTTKSSSGHTCYVCGGEATIKYGSYWYCTRHWAMVKTVVDNS